MTGSIFNGASKAVTVPRARNVDASVVWYRDKLGLEPLHVGADGPDHPFATFSIAGSVVTLGNCHKVRRVQPRSMTPAATW